MAPLSCASLNDIYGSEYSKYSGLSPEEISNKVSQTFKNNNNCANENGEYQQGLKNTQIAGTPKFNESYASGNNQIPSTNNNNNNIPPNLMKTVNNSQYANRPAYTDINNEHPSNTGFSMFNRFQSREHFSSNDHIIELLEQLVLLLKVVVLILVLLFIIIITK